MSEDDTLDTFGRFWPEARTLLTAQQPFDPSRWGQDTVSLQYPMEQRRREKRTWPARRRLLYAREAGRSRAREREVALGASHARVHVKITCMRVLAKCQLLFFFPLLIFFPRADFVEDSRQSENSNCDCTTNRSIINIILQQHLMLFCIIYKWTHKQLARRP